MTKPEITVLEARIDALRRDVAGQGAKGTASAVSEASITDFALAQILEVLGQVAADLQAIRTKLQI